MQNKWDDALLMLKQGKLLVFDDQTLESDFYHQIGDAYYGLKNYNIAFENYDQSLSLNENNPILLNNYSYYLALQNKSLDKAENLILKALKFYLTLILLLTHMDGYCLEKNNMIKLNKYYLKL